MMASSSLVYLSIGIVRRTKNPRPSYSSLASSNNLLLSVGKGNVVLLMYPIATLSAEIRVNQHHEASGNDNDLTFEVP